MDRKALSDRIQGLSEVFANDNAMHQDLKAMAYVLSQMSEEKYASVISSEFTADKEAAFGGLMTPGHQGVEPRATGMMKEWEKLPSKPGIQRPGKEIARMMIEKGLVKDERSDDEILREIGQALKEERAKKAPVTPSAVPQGTPVPVRMASEDGAYWNKDASDKVRDFLLKDVVGMDKSICCDTGRHLDKPQMPDATKTQSRPSTLKEEQTPKLSEALKSNIVEKAKAAKPVNKMATEDPAICKKEQDALKKIEEGVADLKKVEKEEKAKGESGSHEKGEEKAIEHLEKGVDKIKDLENKEMKSEDKKEDKKDEKDASNVQVEGIELSATEMDVTLSSDDEAALSKLFN